MTQSWPNTTIKLADQHALVSDAPPEDMAQACRKLAISTLGGALIQFGIAAGKLGEGLSSLVNGTFDVGVIFFLVPISLLIAGLWLMITNWDNPHAQAAYTAISFGRQSIVIRAIVIAVAIISLGVMFVALFGAPWLKVEFGIPLGSSKLIVGFWFLAMGIVSVGQAGYFFGRATYKS
jgi:hypothetical protein